MSFTLHSRVTQAVIIVVADTFDCDTDTLFVNLPLGEMLGARVTPLSLAKLTMNLERELGVVAQWGKLSSGAVSINALVDIVLPLIRLQKKSA